VGRLTSGAYGYTLGGAVGIGTVGRDVDVEAGGFTVECRGMQYPATVARRPFYDPTGARMKG
jgi:glycine cleavage system aminomethyltransferase T